MVIVKLFGGKIIEIEDAEARPMLQSIAARAQFVMVAGQAIALSEIKGVYTWEKWLELSGEEGVVVPEPVPEVHEAGKTPTPWKAEQFAALQRRFREHMKIPVESRPEWLAWIETEVEFRAVMAGEAEWPTRERSREERPGTPFRWVRKVVTDRAYGQFYGNRPGYHVLEKFGTDVAIGFRKVIKPGMSLPMYQLPPGESWANQDEIARLEDRAGVRA